MTILRIGVSRIFSCCCFVRSLKNVWLRLAMRWSLRSGIPAVGQVAATGIFTQDASGNITGTQTRSLNGSVADETFTGTATVYSDCTGTDSIQVFQDGSL